MAGRVASRRNATGVKLSFHLFRGLTAGVGPSDYGAAVLAAPLYDFVVCPADGQSSRDLIESLDFEDCRGRLSRRARHALNHDDS